VDRNQTPTSLSCMPDPAIYDQMYAPQTRVDWRRDYTLHSPQNEDGSAQGDPMASVYTSNDFHSDYRGASPENHDAYAQPSHSLGGGVPTLRPDAYAQPSHSHGGGVPTLRPDAYAQPSHSHGGGVPTLRPDAYAQPSHSHGGGVPNLSLRSQPPARSPHSEVPQPSNRQPTLAELLAKHTPGASQSLLQLRSLDNGVNQPIAPQTQPMNPGTQLSFSEIISKKEAAIANVAAARAAFEKAQKDLEQLKLANATAAARNRDSIIQRALSPSARFSDSSRSQLARNIDFQSTPVPTNKLTISSSTLPPTSTVSPAPILQPSSKLPSMYTSAHPSSPRFTSDTYVTSVASRTLASQHSLPPSAGSPSLDRGLAEKIRNETLSMESIKSQKSAALDHVATLRAALVESQQKVAAARARAAEIASSSKIKSLAGGRAAPPALASPQLPPASYTLASSVPTTLPSTSVSPVPKRAPPPLPPAEPEQATKSPERKKPGFVFRH